MAAVGFWFRRLPPIDVSHRKQRASSTMTTSWPRRQ